MRKLKSLVCGSKFGQFYIDAISKMKECVEFIGIFSNGSERSRLCAEKYNVNLYTSIDKIPEDIDIVFIAVRTGVMGGDGSELALKFLSKGIHVFIEQPIHIDEMKKCVKCSIEKGVFFHVANFYKYMDTVHKYIECSKGLLRKNEILSIECACANQVIYSLLDNILRIFREKARFSIENFWIQNQDFFIASGSINDIPLSIKVYNSVNTVDSDSYCYYLQQINIYTSEGMLFMVDVNGPIIWKPQFRAAHDLFIKKGDELDQRIFDSKMYWYESESELSYKDIFCKKWIDAIKKEIKEFIDNIYFEKMTEYRRKIQSEIVIPSIWGLITQKIGYPRLYQNANHAVDLNNYVLDFFEEKNTFLNDSLEIKKTANNIDFYLEPDITYGYVEEAKHIMNKIYDASKWPMFDIGCVSGHNKAILGISIDFMIADWASIWILIDEFEKLYQNPTASLPRIEYNFSDYIYCEKVKKYTPKYFSDREYWIERLAEFPEKPDLPIINAVENIDKNVIFKRYKFVVEKNKWKTIQLISSKMGLTSSAVILSAYAMVISKWSTNKKFVMNLTTLNRNSYESKVNNIVGDFTSINLLAVDFSIQKTNSASPQ